jgi:hypothetical protein
MIDPKDFKSLMTGNNETVKELDKTIEESISKREMAKL